MEDTPTEKDTNLQTYIFEQYEEGYEVLPQLTYYTQVQDWLGEAKKNLAITLIEVETGDDFGVLTVNLGEFIGAKNAAYIDTNNLPGADTWLIENGLAKATGLTKDSGYCTYPLVIFDEGFLRSIDDGTLADYHAQFEPTRGKRAKTQHSRKTSKSRGTER